MFATRHQSIRTPRRNRALYLVLAAIAVLAARVLPACGIDSCSSLLTMTSVHANMPCCALDSSIAPRDFGRPHTTAFAGSLIHLQHAA